MNYQEVLLNVIAKVRKMYQYDIMLKDIVSTSADIRIIEKDGTLLLGSVIFRGQAGDIVVKEKEIVFNGNEAVRTLITYENWEEFMKL